MMECEQSEENDVGKKMDEARAELQAKLATRLPTHLSSTSVPQSGHVGGP